MCRRLKPAALLFLLLALACTEGRRAAEPIEPGRHVQGTLNGGSEVLYRIGLKAGEYFQLQFNKQSTGLALIVLRPDGTTLRTLPCAHDGAIQLADVADVSGVHHVRVHACVEPTATVSYELVAAPQTPANQESLKSVEFERLLASVDERLAQYIGSTRQAALADCTGAVARWKALEKWQEVSRASACAARLQRDLGDPDQALRSAKDALDAAKLANAQALEADALLVFASIKDNQGNTQQAVEYALDALRIAQSTSNSKIEAESQYWIGRAKYDSNEYDDASAALNQSAKLARARNDRLGEATAHVYLGAVNYDLRRWDISTGLFEPAIAVFRAFGDKKAEATATTYLAHTYAQLGRTQQALATYQAARILLDNSDDFATQASLFNGLGLLHVQLGDNTAGLTFLEVALEKNRAAMDQIGIASSERWIGETQHLLGDFSNAMASYERSLALFKSIPSEKMEATLLQDIAVLQDANGDKTGALNNLHRSLSISRKINDARLEAWITAGIGRIYQTAGDCPQALKNYEGALRYYEQTRKVSEHATVLYGMASCLRSLGKLAESRSRSEAALKMIEQFRADVTNTGLRTSFFSSMTQQYDLYVDTLMRLNDRSPNADLARLAFESSERSRARALLDSIKETQVSITEGVDPKQVERSTVLKAQLARLSDRYTDAVARHASPENVAQIGRQVDLLTKDIDILEGTIRQQSPRYAALTRPEPLTLAQVQHELLDPDSLLLRFALGDERSYLWAVTTNDFKSYVLPKRADIERRVMLLRQLLTARVALPDDTPASYQTRVLRAETQYTEVALELSRTLLGPLSSTLGKRRLIIVADGVLQYLPFAALPASGDPSPLIVDHEIVSLPSVSVLSVLREEARLRRRPDRVLAVFADPVFQKQQASKENALPPNTTAAALLRGDTPAFLGSLASLPATRLEAEGILSLVAKDTRLAALGFAATKAAAMNPDLSRYRIVHFATHTMLFDERPDMSSLVLSLVNQQGESQDGLLRLREVYNLKLSAELVVLSACDTAIGREIKGEGLISMVRGFMYSGTPRVMATLWKVDDDATAALMKEFYTHLLSQRQTPAAALREAQIALMRKQSTRAPYYWAAFQLHGEWQ